jgi:hypothetical protein
MELRATAETGTVVLVREAILVDATAPDEPGPIAWIVPCADLLAASDLPNASCGSAPIHLVDDGVTFPDGAVLRGYPLDETGSNGDMSAEVALDASGATAALLAPGTSVPAGSLPDLLVDPSVVEGSGGAVRPLFVLVGTDGDARAIERARTTLEVAMPTGGPATGAEVSASVTRIVDELGRVVSLGVVMTMAVAGSGLAVAVAGSLLDRRRPFALLRLSGVTLGHLRSVLLLEAAAPLVAVAIISCALGVLISQLLLRIAAGLSSAVPLPDPSLLLLLVASVAGALVIVAGALPLVGPVTDLEETRFE